MRTLDIIFTSDTHGHVFPVDYPTGRPEASGLLNLGGQIEKDGNTLILDGGDTLQGTPLSQYYIAHGGEYPFHPMAEAFNAMGCDYFTLGNHDFNFGYEALKDYLGSMQAVCLCANVEDLRGELGIRRDEIRVMENGLRVGITGVVTDYVMVWEQPENLEWLRVTDAFEAARQEYEKLRDKCDICICIYHGGFEENLETGELLTESRENVACQIARELGYDLLLTGHQHMAVEGKLLYGTYAVQPPANAGKYAEVRVEVEESVSAPGEMESEAGESMVRRKLRITSRLVPVGTVHAPQPCGRLLSLEQDTQRWLDEPVGLLQEAIPPEEKLEAALHGSRLADLFNEVQLANSDGDFSCTSLGNQPVGLEKRVSMREICAACLFANTLVVLEVDETVLRSALERCASYFTLEAGNIRVSDCFLQPKVEHYNYDFYAGLQYEFDLTKPVGQRVTKLLKMDGTPLGNRKYKLVTSNYRATGTGGYEAIGNCPVLWRGAEEMPDLVAAYIREHTPLAIRENRRIVIKRDEVRCDTI